MPTKCPNYDGCRLVQTDVVTPDSEEKAKYIYDYCQVEETWRNCKRYQIRKSLWICPDFVLPDSEVSEDEVAERYDKGEK